VLTEVVEPDLLQSYLARRGDHLGEAVGHSKLGNLQPVSQKPSGSVL